MAEKENRTLYNRLMQDIRFVEGLKACINCGTCTAICPAAEFYNYEPRAIVDIIQLKDDARIEELLRGDEIWYCGECMSCKTRCPRGNAPGLVIIALRTLSQELGYFTDSEKGRQQLALKRMIGETILNYGYCVYAEHLHLDKFPEQGPVWEWISGNLHDVMDRLGANFKGIGAGILRKIDDKNLEEIHKIFDVTGGTDRLKKIERYSRVKAREKGMEFTGKGTDDGYFRSVYTENNQKHTKE
jgi:heterodisulfide reductase subunit C